VPLPPAVPPVLLSVSLDRLVPGSVRSDKQEGLCCIHAVCPLPSPSS
jgi:hypothetical protein